MLDPVEDGGEPRLGTRSEGRVTKLDEKVSKSEGRDWIGASNSRFAWVEQQGKEMERGVGTSNQGGDELVCYGTRIGRTQLRRWLASLVTQEKRQRVAENEREREENRVAQYTLL